MPGPLGKRLERPAVCHVVLGGGVVGDLARAVPDRIDTPRVDEWDAVQAIVERLTDETLPPSKRVFERSEHHAISERTLHDPWRQTDDVLA